MPSLKLYIIQFVHSRGNGYALVKAYSPNQAEDVLKTQTSYNEVNVVAIRECKWQGRENQVQVVEEGAVTTYGPFGRPGTTFTYDDMTLEDKEDLLSLIGADVYEKARQASESALIAETSAASAASSAERAEQAVSSTYSKEEVDTLLGSKADTSSLAAVATSGSYNDLLDKPEVSPQEQADWAEQSTTAASYIKNKPDIYTKTESDSRYANKAGDINQSFSTSALQVGEYATFRGNAPTIGLQNTINPSNPVEVLFPYQSGTLALAENVANKNGSSAESFSASSIILANGTITSSAPTIRVINTLNEAVGFPFGKGDGTLALTSDVASAINLSCPLILDTRSSEVVAVTGNAPFAALVDGQRIILKLAYKFKNNPTLTLTLSDNTQTAAIPIYYRRMQNMTRPYGNNAPYSLGVEGEYILMVYDATNSRWFNLDGDSTYIQMNDSDLQGSGNSTPKITTSKLLRDNFYTKSEINAMPIVTEDEMWNTINGLLDIVLYGNNN